MTDSSPSGLGQRILDACEKRGWTQADLGREGKITKAALSLIINGHRKPSAAMLKKLSLALGVSADFLLSGTSIENEPDPAAQAFFRKYNELDDEGRELLDRMLRNLPKRQG